MPDQRRADKAPGSTKEPEQDLKHAVAEEVGVDPDRYGGNVPARKWGALGGHMVKRLIAKGEESMAAKGGKDDDPEPDGGR